MRQIVVLLAFAVAFVACDSDSGRSLDELGQAAEEARLTGDADAYMRLLRDAAERDDLGALRTLADIASRGYFQLVEGRTRTNTAVRHWPGEGARWERRYQETLERQAGAGDQLARYQRATNREL